MSRNCYDLRLKVCQIQFTLTNFIYDNNMEDRDRKGLNGIGFENRIGRSTTQMDQPWL